MNRQIIPLILMIEALIGLYAGAYVYSYLYDIEVSRGNTFTAGTWNICGKLLNFTVPKNVIQGQIANFTVTFQNCGDIMISAVAKVKIQRGENGSEIIIIQSEQMSVEAGQIIDFQLQWNTTGYNPGNYRAIAWVEYNSQATQQTEPIKFHVTNQKAADINVLKE